MGAYVHTPGGSTWIIKQMERYIFTVFPWLKFCNNRLSIHCIVNGCTVPKICILYRCVGGLGSIICKKNNC